MFEIPRSAVVFPFFGHCCSVCFALPWGRLYGGGRSVMVAWPRFRSFPLIAYVVGSYMIFCRVSSCLMPLVLGTVL